MRTLTHTPRFTSRTQRFSWTAAVALLTMLTGCEGNALTEVSPTQQAEATAEARRAAFSAGALSTAINSQFTADVSAPTMTDASNRLSVSASETLDGTFSEARSGGVTLTISGSTSSNPPPTAFNLSGGSVNFTSDGRSMSEPVPQHVGQVLDQAFAERYPGGQIQTPMARQALEANSGSKFKDLSPDDKVKKWRQDGYEVRPKGNGKYEVKIKINKLSTLRGNGSGEAVSEGLTIEMVYDSVTDTVTETRVYDGGVLVSERNGNDFRLALPGTRAASLSTRH